MASKLTPSQAGAVVGVELACIELVCRRRGIALHDYIGGAVLDRLQFNGWVGELPPEEAVVHMSSQDQKEYLIEKEKINKELAVEKTKMKIESLERQLEKGFINKEEYFRELKNI